MHFCAPCWMAWYGGPTGGNPMGWVMWSWGDVGRFAATKLYKVWLLNGSRLETQFFQIDGFFDAAFRFLKIYDGRDVKKAWSNSKGSTTFRIICSISLMEIMSGCQVLYERQVNLLPALGRLLEEFYKTHDLSRVMRETYQICFLCCTTGMRNPNRFCITKNVPNK